MRYTLLEPLRGLAALWVFCFHYQFSETFQQKFPTLLSIFRVGHLGVPMFFVLSGFCITASARSTIRRQQPWGNFLYRRLRRIYPPYWFSILVVISIPFLMEFVSSLKTGHYSPPSPDNLPYGYLSYSPKDWFLVATLARVFADVPGAMNLQYKFTTINAVYWTLAIEVQFYFVVTLALVWRKHFYAFLTAVTALSLPTLYFTSWANSGVFLPYWPMFAIGILLYYIFERGLTPTRLFGKTARRWSGLLTFGLVAALITLLVAKVAIGPLPFALFFGTSLFFAEPLDALFEQKVLSSNFAAVRWFAVLFMAVGAMSYSLYLLHARSMYLTMQLLRQVLNPNSILFDLAVIVLTSLGCYAFYWICERPFMSTQQKKITAGEIQSVPNAAGTAASI